MRSRVIDHWPPMLESLPAVRAAADDPCAQPHANLWLTAIVLALTDAALVIDIDERIIVFNATAERMFHCGAAAAIGRRLSRFVVLPRIIHSVTAGRSSAVHGMRTHNQSPELEATFTNVEVGTSRVCMIALREPRHHAPVATLNDGLDQASRIARALHDEVSQLLTSAYLALAEAARDASPMTCARIHDAEISLDQLEGQLHRLAHEIRPRILDELGLVPALRFLVEGVAKRRRICVELNATMEVRVPPLIETTLYRVIAEALTNATMHGKAMRVAISIERTQEAVCCVIEDDGIGFDAMFAAAESGEPGFGLFGMRDQLGALGGTLDVDSAPGYGTRLSILIPLEQ